jgi:transcription initiation factor TFIID TATA-box-binding protein
VKNFDDSKEKDVELDNLDYKVNNIVATVKVEISEKFDLVKIARKLTDAEYFPERFPGLILRQKDPRATFLIFSTGKMVITGLEEVNNADIAVTKLVKKIKKFGIKNTTPEIIIQNMVASGDFHQNIDLNKAVILMESIMYEPEVFPGLIYNMKNPRAVFLLFSTGKFVCTGVKTEKILEIAILKLIKEIKAMDLGSEKAIEKKFELSFI